MKAFLVLPLLAACASPDDARAGLLAPRDGHSLPAEPPDRAGWRYISRMRLVYDRRLGDMGRTPGKQDRRGHTANCRPEPVRELADAGSQVHLRQAGR